MKRVATVALVFVVAVSFCVPSMTYVKADAKKPRATSVHYYPNDTVPAKERTGIKSFTIEPYTYYNMSKNTSINPSGKSTMKLDDATLERIAVNNIFPKWGVIAESFFRDQADQLVTIEGSGMMSNSKTDSNSFDKHFSFDRPGVDDDYSDYDWSVRDLASQLASSGLRHDGETNWDEMRREGISAISSLADARKMMGQSLRNCADDDNNTVDDFLGNKKDKSDNLYRLPDLADDKTGSGFCNIVTSVNRAGSSADYDYVSFGLAVYDFDLTPVAAKNLKYIEAAEKYDNGKDILMGKAGNVTDLAGINFTTDTQDGARSYLKNATPHEASQSAGLENTSTEESSITQEDTYEWGMEQQIGTEWNIGGFGDGDCMFPRCTLSISNSWHELWSTTKSKTETKSVSKTKTVNTEMTLPPHSVAKVTQSVENSNVDESYQQPVVLNYKVAIFAMSGDYYNGSGAGGIEPSTYDKQWMNVIFDGSDGSNESGCSGLASLYNRAVVNRDTARYDAAKGKYRAYCDKSAWSKREKIRWGEIDSAIAEDDRGSHSIPSGATGGKSNLTQMSTELPLMEKAHMLESSSKNITSSIDQVLALYPLSSVSLKDNHKQYDVQPGEKVYLDSIELEGENTYGVEFYGFRDDWGSWYLIDDDKEIIEDGSEGDEDGIENGRVKKGVLTLVTDEDLDSQWIEVDKRGTFDGVQPSQYIRWEFDDDVQIISNENLINDEPYMSKDDLDKVFTPSIKINPSDSTSFVKLVDVTGDYKGVYTKSINLNSVLDAEAYDGDLMAKDIQLLWEDNDVDGIEVEPDGTTTFTEPGKYKVRAFCYDSGRDKVTSDWKIIEATEEPIIDNIEFNKPSDLDENDLTITKKEQVKGFDLKSYISIYDQYGEKWNGEKPEFKFEVTDYSGHETDDADIDQDDILSVYKAGGYKVSARALDEEGNELDFEIKPIKLRVAENMWLDEITFEEPALNSNQLKIAKTGDVVEIKDLRSQLKYYNQNNEEWTGDKPRVEFRLKHETSNAEIKGNSFFAYAPGNYQIEAISEGYDIKPITVEVKEDYQLVIKPINPNVIKINELGGSADLDLIRSIDYTTYFNSKFPGDKPALEFTLDEDVKGASIVTEQEVNEETGKTKDIVKFVSDTPGEYSVHVAPKNASEYEGKIKDIEVIVEKAKRVESVGMDFDEVNKEPSMRIIKDGAYTLEDLKQFTVFYDQFGDALSAKELEEMDDSLIPAIKGYSVYPDDTGATLTNNSNDKFDLSVTKEGSYAVTPIYQFDGEDEEFGQAGTLSVINEDIYAQILKNLEYADNLSIRISNHFSNGEISGPAHIALLDAVYAFTYNTSRAQNAADINSAMMTLNSILDKYMPENLAEKVKKDAKKVISTYKNSADYRTAERNLLSIIVSNATSKINKIKYGNGGLKKVKNDANAIVSAAKADMDKLLTNAQYKLGKTKVVKAVKKKKSKKLKVKVKRLKYATGYQVAIYNSKKNAKKNKKAIAKAFSKKKKNSSASAKKSTKSVLIKFKKTKKIKKAKKLFVRARAYNMDGTKKVFGPWSKIKKAKIK